MILNESYEQRWSPVSVRAVDPLEDYALPYDKESHLETGQVCETAFPCNSLDFTVLHAVGLLEDFTLL